LPHRIHRGEQLRRHDDGTRAQKVGRDRRGECFFYVALALGIALAAVDLLLPGFNGFLQRDLRFDYIHDPSLGVALVGIAALVGLVASSYPAFVLSRFRPNEVLRGATFLAGGSGRLRQTLVVFQFATLIGLIVVTLTIQRQERYAIEDRLRVPGDEIYMTMGGCPRAFAEAVERLPGVDALSCDSSVAIAQCHDGADFALPKGGRD
jgi:putative ABC transport system permease protein